MKNIYRFYFLLVAVCFAGCGDMTDIYQEYLDRGETIYVGKVDSLRAFPGNKRVMLMWEIGADPKLTECIVYWDSKSDSLSLPIVRNGVGGVQKMSVIVGGLTERGHIFEVYTRDMYGNVSLKTEKSSLCYGDKYASRLANRSIKEQEATIDSVVISWASADNSVGVELNYINSSGQPKIVFVKPDSDQTVLKDYVSGGNFSYSTLYKPSDLCIDTFRTAEVQMDFGRAESLVSKENWRLVEESSHGEFGGFGAGERAFDDDGETSWHSSWDGVTLPQWITVDLQGTYEVTAVELLRPDGDWRSETKEVEIWICEDPDADFTVEANFSKLGTIVFAGDEKSKTMKLPEAVNVCCLKCIGTKCVEGKNAVQITEINLKSLQ